MTIWTCDFVDHRSDGISKGCRIPADTFYAISFSEVSGIYVYARCFMHNILEASGVQSLEEMTREEADVYAVMKS